MSSRKDTSVVISFLIIRGIFYFMGYIPPKERFYEDLKKASSDYRLKDKIIICDSNVNDFFKGLSFQKSNIKIKKESEIKKEIDLFGDKVCWVSMGTALTGARPFYDENKGTLKKVDYVLIVVGNYLNGGYNGLHLNQINRDFTYELVAEYGK